MSERLERLRRGMANVGLDGFLVGAPVEDTFHTHAANRRYLSGFTGSMGWLLITTDSAFIAVDFRYFEQAEREATGFHLFRTSGGMENWLPQLLGEAALMKKRVGFEPAGVTVSTYQTMKKALEKLPADERPKLLAAPPLVEELRVIKEPSEVAALHWGAMPPAQPRDRPVQAGEPIVIDMGVRAGGYCSDLTRTIAVGGEDARFREVYDIVLTAQLTAEELVRSGMGGEEAHTPAHNVIAEPG